MRLGTDTGSLINHLTAGRGIPKVGEGATICYWTDRSAGTVIEYDEQRGIVRVQADKVTRLNPGVMTDAQDYSYEPDPNGAISTWKRDKRGRWRQAHAGESGRLKMDRHGAGISFGRRDAYHDYSF